MAGLDAEAAIGISFADAMNIFPGRGSSTPLIVIGIEPMFLARIDA